MKFIQYTFFSTVFIFFNLACAHSSKAEGPCWQSEYDPDTMQVYESEDKYDHHLQSLQNQKPSTPDFFDLLKAYNVVQSNKNEKLKNDKAMHCFIGCRISQKVNYESADYAGWKKEVDDIKDCNLSSHFEFADWFATQEGARVGGHLRSKAECIAECESLF